jgi:gas vesicle protein
MTRDLGRGTILTFILGAGVGAAVALLFAPKAGEELRGDIAEGMSDGLNHVRRIGNDLKLRTQKLVGKTQVQVQDAMEAGRNAYSEAKKA